MMMMTQQPANPALDIRELPTACPVAYQLLSWGMVYPDAQHLTGLPDWLAALRETFAALGVPATDVEEALQNLPPNQADQRQSLQVEYTRLFINAVPHVLAPPYASAYANDGQLMGQPAEVVLQAYRSAGLTFLADDVKDLPDHLAAMLEFLAYLARQEQTARTDGQSSEANLWLARAQNFLSQLLLPWVSAWHARVAEHDRTNFYAALARLVTVWLQAEAARLGVAELT